MGGRTDSKPTHCSVCDGVFKELILDKRDMKLKCEKCYKVRK